MEIIKRNGKRVEFNPNKILNRIKKASNGLNVDAVEIFTKVAAGIADGMTTKEMDELIANVSASYTAYHPDYSQLAGSICVSRIHKEISDDMNLITKKLHDKGLVSSEYYEKYKDFAKDGKIQASLDFEKDFKFDYFSWKRLSEIYLLKYEDDVLERPQHMYMRIAISVSANVEDALSYYESVSNHELSPATPIMTNSGTPNAQMASCELHFNVDDSREGILKTFNNICTSSSLGAGIGLALHNIRSRKSYLSSSGGKAGGLLKLIKIYNEGLRFFNQRGKRPGSAAMYIEPWHKDIIEFLEIRKNTGKEQLRAKDIFTALWIPDNFMKAVENNEDYYLFCPNDIKKAGLKPLYDIWGDEFEAEYNKAVELGLGERVKSQEIWLKILESQIETGTPYMLYKDHANRKTNHQNYGTIKSSNLCTEILEYTDAENVAICTLSSIPLQNCMNVNGFDFEKLRLIVHKIVKSLNYVIDTNNYSVEEGRKAGLSQRSIGIGVQGLADLSAKLKLSFTGDEFKKLNKEIFETIYFSAIEESCRIAKEEGIVYEKFEGSPMSKGIFQYHMWGLKNEDLSGRWDWDTLIKNVMEFGIANSLFTAPMPTASSAAIIMSNEAFEWFYSNIYVRKVKGGEFTIVNKYLVKELEEIGKWNKEIRNRIIMNDGSIQDIEEIPQEIRNRYPIIWEVSQRLLIEMAADRGPFIDQSQSMNIFLAKPNVGRLTSSHFLAWKKGLKTASYYIRSQAVSTGAKHLGIEDSVKQIEPVVKESEEEKPEDSPFDCLNCSS